MVTSDRIPMNSFKPGGIDTTGFSVFPGNSNANNSIGLQAALNRASAQGGGLVTSSFSGRIYLDRAVHIPRDVSWEILPGAIVDTTLLSVPGITSSGTRKVRVFGDGKIVCTEASVPTFSNVNGLSVDVRIEDANGIVLLPTITNSAAYSPVKLPLDSTIAREIALSPADQVGGVKVLTAIIRNPLSDISRSNEPAAIRVNLPDGWAPDVECIRVRDSSGTYVPWQWEPCRDARTDTNISTYASTNIKAGNVWIMVPSIAGGGSVTYYVEVWPVAQSQSFAPNITATSGGTDFTWTHADWSANFNTSWSWNLNSFKRGAFDFFAAADAGIDAAYKPSNAGTAEYVGLTTGVKSQTSTFHGERDASTFGYGVVYRWFVARSVGITEANVQHEIWYRGYANGKIEILAIHSALATIGATDLKLFFSVIKPDASGGNHEYSNEELYVESNYGSDNRLLSLYRSIKNSSDADMGATAVGVFPGGTSYVTPSPIRIRAGANATNYELPEDAERREYMILLISEDVFASDRLRVWNPLVSCGAHFADAHSQLQRFGVQARSFLNRYTAYSSADDDDWKAALLAGAWISSEESGSSGQWALTSLRMQQWLDTSSRGPADGGLGGRLFAAYKSADTASGWEHVGRDGQAFKSIYDESLRRGDAENAATALAIIHGIADFAVLAEADNGSTGQIILNYSDVPPTANPNATAEAAIAIATAESLGYTDDTLRAALDRIWRALTNALEFRNWMPYLFSSPTGYVRGSIQAQSLSYFHRDMIALHLVPVFVPRLSVDCDVAYCMMADTNSDGQANEYLDNYNFFRRGSSATLMHFAVNLAYWGNVSEIEQAIIILSHVNELSPADEPSPWPIDGWANTTPRSVGDVLCAMLMSLPMHRVLTV